MIRRSKEQWLALFQQHTDSGLSAAEFCKQHNLCDKYFSLRKNKLLKPAIQNNFVPVVVRTTKEPKAPQHFFSETPFQCRLDHCVLQFSSLPDVTWFAQLMKALA
jgi:hypothetical protein